MALQVPSKKVRLQKISDEFFKELFTTEMRTQFVNTLFQDGIVIIKSEVVKDDLQISVVTKEEFTHES